MKSKLFFVAVLSFCLVVGRSGVAAAHDPDDAGGFANESLQGTYAAITFTPDVGVIGLCEMDGEGAFTCDSTVNVPGDNNDRMVFPATSTGSYTMTAGGLGIALEEQEGPDGSTTSVQNLFSVTDARSVGHTLLATQLDSFSPGENGATDHSVLKRLPDLGNVDGGFSNASIVGAYAMSSPIGQGIAGICDMDGAGSYTCNLALIVPSENGDTETLVLSNTGTYSVTSNGMGSVHYVIPLPDGSALEGDDDIVISAAETEGPFVVATEITDIGRDAGDENGALSVSILKRLPDLAGGETVTDTEPIRSLLTGGE